MKAPLSYSGSVKDVMGPVTIEGQSAVVFAYSDAYSVFDWGRMPDPLPQKGQALALLAAHFFEQLERPESWQKFFNTPDGKKLAPRLASLDLASSGLPTHYLGLLNGEELTNSSGLKIPTHQMAVKKVGVTRPRASRVLGREIPDYQAVREAPPPRLVPLEVVFRFSLPAGSSLRDRLKRDPDYLLSRGYGDYDLNGTWDFPILECFTKLESTDRTLELSEAAAISGLSGEKLNELLLKTAAVAGWLRECLRPHGLTLADGKLEWAEGASGELILVDAIGPDELRIVGDGQAFSKEFLRHYYRKLPWYAELARAKAQATRQGLADWKQFAPPPPALTPAVRETATQLYLALANSLTGRTWFPQAWDLKRVTDSMREALLRD